MDTIDALENMHNSFLHDLETKLESSIRTYLFAMGEYGTNAELDRRAVYHLRDYIATRAAPYEEKERKAFERLMDDFRS